MYLPYFRGKLYENAAIREYVERNYTTNKIIPILEPVKDNIPLLCKTLDTYERLGQQLFLIVNPKVGDLSTNHNAYQEKLLDIVGNYSSIKPAVILSPQVSSEFVHTFIDHLDKICFISFDSISDRTIMEELHASDNVMTHVFIKDISRSFRLTTCSPNKSVILDDCFPQEKKNADYPDENSFSDEIFFYHSEGRLGFSDFSVIGSSYSDTGGPAFAVTIHLTYEHNESQEIRIRHFVSDIVNNPTDPGGKFLQAVDKLVRWLDQNPELVYLSHSIEEFRRFHAEQHYPGLGYLKKMSILHHLELCNHILNR